jgi:glutaredoxin 3
MSSVTVYTTDMCPFCRSAKALLDKRGVAYEEINLARDPDARDKLADVTGGFTFPQIVIGEHTVGGFEELRAADRSGELAGLLAA